MLIFFHTATDCFFSFADLAVPPKVCAEPVLSTLCIQCDSINTEVGGSHLCTVQAEGVTPPTSTSAFAPTYLTTTNTPSLLQPSVSDTRSRPAPIQIPSPTLTALDINRVPTPLSGRGDRKALLFPFMRSPSPRVRSPQPYFHYSSTTTKFPHDSQDLQGRPERTSAYFTSPTPTLPRSHIQSLGYNMHNESLAIGRYPTSPLSSKPPCIVPGLSSQNQRRGNHGRHTSRNMQLNMGRYHPSNFAQADSTSLLAPSSTSFSTVQPPQISYTRAPAPVQVESPRLLREKHREFIEKARQTSQLAASPFSPKPDAPRLDPLGSPHGAVTPLALEEAGDYFTVGGAGKLSPAASPGPRSPRPLSISSDEDSKLRKSRKLDS